MRRSMSVVTSFVLAAGLIVGASPGANAATCSVTNATTGTAYTTLQDAIDASVRGDTLLIRGTCIPRPYTTIRGKILRLVGVPTAAQPSPTLDGQGRNILRIWDSTVVIRNLTITNGRGSMGPVYGSNVHLTLAGTTSVVGNRGSWASAIGIGGDGAHDRLILKEEASVTDNTGRYGPAISIGEGGRLILLDSATVSGNMSKYSGGGGIGSSGAYVRLGDESSVTGNAANCNGGGIDNVGGVVSLTGRSVVTGNVTEGDEAVVVCGRGGGIANHEGGVVLLGIRGGSTVAVTGNTANRGGGIFNWPDSQVFACSDSTFAISPNEPDDPPQVQEVCK